MTPKEIAIAMLAQNLPTGVIAAACGVEDSYISQLRADPAVQEMLAASRPEAQSLPAEAVAFDNRLDHAESLALERIEKSIQFANLGQAMSAFRILNSARRRKEALGPQAPQVSIAVNLTLPAIAVPRYVTNSSNEIIEVEGQTMISATPKQLDTILSAKPLAALQRAAARLETIEQHLQAPKAGPQTAARVKSVLSPDML